MDESNKRRVDTQSEIQKGRCTSGIAVGRSKRRRVPNPERKIKPGERISDQRPRRAGVPLAKTDPVLVRAEGQEVAGMAV